MTKVLDNFHSPSPPMVVAPWVDYGNYPTLESLIEKKIIVFDITYIFRAWSSTLFFDEEVIM